MRWERVLVADNPLQAGWAKALLEGEGLSVDLRGMELWSAAVEVLYAEGAAPSVWVPARHAETARRVLAAARAEQESDWWCDACGERNGARFEVCWNCGVEAPENADGAAAE